MIFDSREQAGELLAQKLLAYKEKKDVIVLGITRGGVVPAKAIADSLKVPLDIIVIKKIGAPSNPELAIGAVGPPATQAELGEALRAGPGGTFYWDKELCQRMGITKKQKAISKKQKEEERKEREEKLRGGKPPLDVKNKIVILVDDGVATGATVLAAEKFLRKAKAKLIVLAVPVISLDTMRDIERYFDQVVVLNVSEEFYAVGQFYLDFPQINDDEVKKLLVY